MDDESSETLYEILECDIDANLETIKENYRRLAVLHHPDKCADSNRFVAVDKAWKVLRDPQSRRDYDARLMSETAAQEPLLYSTVTIEDLKVSDDVFLYSCKCGGEYIIPKSELSTHTDHPDCNSRFLVECTDCSLCICVICKSECSDSHGITS